MHTWRGVRARARARACVRAFVCVCARACVCVVCVCRPRAAAQCSGSRSPSSSLSLGLKRFRSARSRQPWSSAAQRERPRCVRASCLRVGSDPRGRRCGDSHEATPTFESLSFGGTSHAVLKMHGRFEGRAAVMYRDSGVFRLSICTVAPPSRFDSVSISQSRRGVSRGCGWHASSGNSRGRGCRASSGEMALLCRIRWVQEGGRINGRISFLLPLRLGYVSSRTRVF